MLSWFGSQESECKVDLENNNNTKKISLNLGEKNISLLGGRGGKVHTP